MKFILTIEIDAESDELADFSRLASKIHEKLKEIKVITGMEVKKIRSAPTEIKSIE